MTMAQLREQRNELAARIRTAAEHLTTVALDDNTDMAELARLQAELKGMNDRMAALNTAYAAQYSEDSEALSATNENKGDATRSVRDMLKSNEYARAFAYAVRNGISPNSGRSDEGCRVLYDALTESGNGGADGGFLVPEDIDHQIRELRRSLDPLSSLFTVEATSTNKGWRVQDIAPTKGMTKLDSEIPTGGVPMDDQPEFAKVHYSLDTYGLIVPVSNELASDEVASLFGYLARWFAKKQIITENLLLKGLLEQLTASNITAADPIAQIKSVLNKALDPMISVGASLLTNQNGYDYLDNLKDANGRPMLQPDPTSPTGMTFKGHKIKMMANSLLPSREVTTTGATKGEYHPLYIGDFAQYGTLFMRQGLELTSTNIGGNSFRTNSIETRGITRMGVSAFDTGAVVRRELFIPAE